MCPMSETFRCRRGCNRALKHGRKEQSFQQILLRDSDAQLFHHNIY